MPQIWQSNLLYFSHWWAWIKGGLLGGDSWGICERVSIEGEMRVEGSDGKKKGEGIGLEDVPDHVGDDIIISIN